MIFSFVTLTGFSPYTGDHTYIYDFDISNSSEVIIAGTTNVNDFTCRYEGAYKKSKKRVTGELNDLTLKVNDASFSLEVYRFRCNNSLMTHEFRETLKAEEFPEIRMQIMKLTFPDKESLKRVDARIKSHIEITCAGQSKVFVVPTSRSFSGDGKVHFQGDFNLKIEDFGIIPPSRAFGLVKVNSLLNINYKLIFGDPKRAEMSKN